MLINIRYTEKESYYMIRLSGLNDDIITGKFDTGAVVTIITSKKLGLTDEQVERLKIHFDKSGIEPEIFYSATDGKMKGYLVKAENVMLYGTMLKRFYYYLILDNSLDKALLGDDFISCCTFNHQTKRDIIITAIDMELYSQSYSGKINCVDIAEIV